VSLVLDSSVTLAWIYADETTQPICDLIGTVIESGAWVPSLWRLEVANALEMGARRGRTKAAFRDAALRDLALLPIRVDPETDTHAWSETLRLAQKHRRSLYDAAYLELALRRDLPLATLDAELKKAAKAEGVATLA
jgi:predicted nucleic acid-binding protein